MYSFFGKISIFESEVVGVQAQACVVTVLQAKHYPPHLFPVEKWPVTWKEWVSAGYEAQEQS